MSSELVMQAMDAPKAAKTKPSADAPIIALNRKHLAWVVAVVLAAVGGGQTAGQIVGPTVQEDPRVEALSAKVDLFGQEMEQMRKEAAERQVRHDRVLSAILMYQIESSRFARETRGSVAVPLELQRAEQRLVEIATGTP